MSDGETAGTVAANAMEELTVYRLLLDDPVVRLWQQAAWRGNAHPAAYYGRLLAALLDVESELPILPGRDLWQRYLCKALTASENVFVRAVESGKAIDGTLRAAVIHDLACLETAFQYDTRRLAADCRLNGRSALPAADASFAGTPADAVAEWLSATHGWAGACEQFCTVLRQNGCGLFRRFAVLQYRHGELQGVAHPDPVTLSDLVGYEEQRNVIVENTARFVRGYPAHNLLLYGDRGTGKSASVKAAAAQFADAGLRLVEIDRHDLGTLPNLLEQLRHRLYKFVLFVDDLSFAEGDESLHHLKVLLEGTVQSVPTNVRLYATSNRRHLVAEHYADKERDARPGDSVQEQLALADRFGRTVVFSAPDQTQYLGIVKALAARAHLPISDAELQRRALAWANWENGRSARTAKQFIVELQGELTASAL